MHLLYKMNHLVEALVPTFSGSQTGGRPKVIKKKGGMAKLMNSVQQGWATSDLEGSLGHESIYRIHEFGHW